MNNTIIRVIAGAIYLIAAHLGLYASTPTQQAPDSDIKFEGYAEVGNVATVFLSSPSKRTWVAIGQSYEAYRVERVDKTKERKVVILTNDHQQLAISMRDVDIPVDTQARLLPNFFEPELLKGGLTLLKTKANREAWDELARAHGLQLVRLDTIDKTVNVLLSEDPAVYAAAGVRQNSHPDRPSVRFEKDASGKFRSSTYTFIEDGSDYIVTEANKQSNRIISQSFTK